MYSFEGDSFSNQSPTGRSPATQAVIQNVTSRSMPDTAAAALSNTRSSQLFEAPTRLPLTKAEQTTIARLDFFKRWYLACHVTYLCSIVVVFSAAFFVLEPNLSALDAFFIAMSTASNCGLQTVNVAYWRRESEALRHILMVCGGVVATSAFQPLLRLLMLRSVRGVFAARATDTPSERRLRAAKRRQSERLYYTSVVCAVTPAVYFVCVNTSIMVLLAAFNTSALAAREVVYMTIAAFHSCVFLSMEKYARDGAVVGFVTVACALGFTAFPVVLRLFMLGEWRVYQCVVALTRKWCAHCSDIGSSSNHINEEHSDANDERTFLLGGAEEEPNSSNEAADHSDGGGDDEFHEDRDADDGVGDSSSMFSVDHWDAAFRAILTSKQPASFHPFLFRTSESVYLGCAWWTLTLAQAAPFWFQQWYRTLAGLSHVYKVYLSICQGAVVRFAAASFVPLWEYSNAHIAITILAMYLPALPISTDRTYRKWRQMFRTSLVRLMTSRLFWLFSAMTSILFAEEAVLSPEVRHTRFDMMTRTFFEVISAYAGCGLSLALPGSQVSFTGSTGVFSKLVIATVLLGGRHRFVDLGIDLGFATLQSDLQCDVASVSAGTAAA